MCTWFALYPLKAGQIKLRMNDSCTFRWQRWLGLGPLLCEQEEVGDSPTGAEQRKLAAPKANGMSIATIILLEVEALDTFWAETFHSFVLESFRSQDPEVTAIEVDVAMGYSSGLFKFHCERVYCEVMDGMMFYAQESVLYYIFKLLYCNSHLCVILLDMVRWKNLFDFGLLHGTSTNTSSSNNNSSSSGSGSLAGTSFESTFFPPYSWLHGVPGSWIAHVVPLLPLLQQQTPPSQKKGFLWDQGHLPRFRWLFWWNTCPSTIYSSSAAVLDSYDLLQRQLRC